MQIPFESIRRNIGPGGMIFAIDGLHREILKTHICSCKSHAPDLGPAKCASVETPKPASSLGPNSLQHFLTYFQVTPHHSSINDLSSLIRPYDPSRTLRSSSAQRLWPNIIIIIIIALDNAPWEILPQTRKCVLYHKIDYQSFLTTSSRSSSVSEKSLD